MIKNRFIGLLGLTIVLVSCDVNNELKEITAEEQPVVALQTTGIDFSTYVAVGASFTAGFTDGAVFIKGQENSFPNILATKFTMANPNLVFNQPLMNDNIGGMVSGNTTVLEPRFYFDSTTGAPTRLSSAPTTQIGLPASNASSFHNLGVPGAKSFHFLAPGYGDPAGLAVIPQTANPYFVRMAPTQATLLAEAVSKTPTFFTLSEVGGNDVLGYATNGGTLDVITPKATFEGAFTAIIDQLTAGDAKGVLANVPYVTDLPYFTAVPYNAIPLDAATATAANEGFAAYNGGIQLAFAGLVAANVMTQEQADAEIAKRTITFNEGQNAIVILDENLTDLTGINPALVNIRQATAQDLILLTSRPILGQPSEADPTKINGVSAPLEDKWVLTSDEVTEIKTATDEYNTIISNAATAKGLAFVDFKKILQDASSTGLVFDNYILNTTFAVGGLVSLDGIHLTSRGYALMANKMLEAIDATYGSNFATATNGLAKADNYPTNYSPTLQ